MREEFGFEPSYTSEETLREFVQRFNPERGRSRSTSTVPAQEPQHDISVQPSQADDLNPPAVSGAGEGAAGV
jgi:hypothetical protein